MSNPSIGTESASYSGSPTNRQSEYEYFQQLNDNVKIQEIKDLYPKRQSLASIQNPVNKAPVLVNPLRNKMMKKSKKWKFAVSTMANNQHNDGVNISGGAGSSISSAIAIYNRTKGSLPKIHSILNQAKEDGEHGKSAGSLPKIA